MKTDELLEQGIAALRAGQKGKARSLLTRVVQQDERNETAWLHLSGTLNTDEGRRACLERVLAINPDNEVARRGLESLAAQKGKGASDAIPLPTLPIRPVVTSGRQSTQSTGGTGVHDVSHGKEREAPNERPQPVNHAEHGFKRAEVAIAAAGLVLTVLLTLSNNIQTWWYHRQQVSQAEKQLQLGQWEIESQGSRFVYSFTFECDSDHDYQLIELLTVRNVGGVRAEDFHIEFYDTGVQVLEAQSEWPNQSVKPEIPWDISDKKVRVPPFPLDADATYTLRMLLANYSSTDVGRVRDIVSTQEGNLVIAAKNKLPGEPQRLSLDVKFAEVLTHEVRGSETLEEIAEEFKVNIDDLVVNNRIDPLADLPIEPGQSLVIRRAECGWASITPARQGASYFLSTIGYHTVRTGETIDCIARAYGVDPWAIAIHNEILDLESIRAGQRLAIPDAYAWLPAGPTCARQWGGPWPDYPCTCASYHTVLTGESLYRISLHYGVSLWRIAECNNISNLSHFQAGDTLCIPAIE